MKKMHSEKYDNCKAIAIREGFLPVICIKDDDWHSKSRKNSEIGQMFCAIKNENYTIIGFDDNGKLVDKPCGTRYHVYASWSKDAWLYNLSPETFESRFALMV